MQRYIGTYSKTREVYVQYRKLKGRKQAKFYEQHTDEITDCQAAKRYFDSLGLKQERAKMIELLTAKNNVERILGATGKEKNHTRQQGAR